jgi:hypothetical protein
MRTTNQLLLSLFGVAIVTTLVYPGRPVSTALQSFATALSNSIRALMGTRDPSTKNPF